MDMPTCVANLTTSVMATQDQLPYSHVRPSMAPPTSNERSWPLSALHTVLQQPSARPNQHMQQPLQMQQPQTTHQPLQPQPQLLRNRQRPMQPDQPRVASNPVLFPRHLPRDSEHSTSVPYRPTSVQAHPCPTSVSSRQSSAQAPAFPTPVPSRPGSVQAPLPSSIPFPAPSEQNFGPHMQTQRILDVHAQRQQHNAGPQNVGVQNVGVQNVGVQNVQASFDMFKNGIPQMQQMLTSYQSACQVVIGTYQQEIWNLNSAIRQKTNIIQSQERHLQQAVTLNQNLASQLNQCTAAADQQAAPKDTTAIPLLEVKQELEVHIKERKELEAVLQQARACLQKANEEKFNLHGELNKSKTDNAKAIDLYKLMYSTQLKSRSDQSKSLENQIACLKLQHAAELKREREKRTRLESGMDSLTRDQLSVINDLQDKVDDQADTISSFELAMLALDEHDGRFEASAEPYADDAAQLEFDLVEEPDDYEEKQAVNLREAVAERNQLRVEIEKMGKEHAAAFDCIRDEHAEEMEEARKKQAAKLQQVHAWRDKLLVEVDKMGKKHAKLETNSQEQESTIGDLRLQVEDQQHIITDLELQKTSSEKNYEKLLALLSESASEEMKMRKMTLESIQQQATQLPVLFPRPSPPGCSTLSGLHQSRNSVLSIANDQHFATLDEKPAFGDPFKPAVTGFIDQASSTVSPISSRGAQLSVTSQSASLPSALNPAETKSPTTISGQNGASPIDRKRKWNRIYSPDKEGPERDGSKR